MTNHRNQMEAKKRSVERRQREDQAPRLTDELPRLATLRFEMDNGDAKYTWQIMVERAPALFDVTCAERACQSGGHDLTASVMRQLRGHSTRFEGEHTCEGEVRGTHCGRTLRYVGLATYRE